MKRLTDFFRGVVFISVLLVCVLPALSKLGAQQPIRFVVMDDYIRAILARDWDAHALDWPQYERGYCLGYQLDFYAGEVAYRVTEIAPPDSVKTSVGAISFSCAGKFPGHMAEMHTHPPTSCATSQGPCFKGGAYAYQCEPSDQDRRWLNNQKDPFSMIQCSREAVVSWMPGPFVEPEETPP